MDKFYYIVFSYDCNLNCSHCFVKNRKTEFNQDKFYSQLKKINDGIIGIFGGQPSLHIDRIKKCLEYNSRISVISTNLLILTEQLMNIYAENRMQVSTSWDYLRFSEQQYIIWKNNLEKIKNNNLKSTVMITLTDQLIDNVSPEKMKELITSWKTDSIFFQPLIPISRSLREKTDRWLCEIDRIWPEEYENIIKKNYLNGNIKHCMSKIMTLQPDGEMHSMCNMSTGMIFEFFEECIECEFKNICMPCKLQKECSFFKEFYRQVKLI